MTVVILAKCKNSIIISTDLQESGHVLDYNSFFEEYNSVVIDGKTYYPINNHRVERGINLTSKLFQFGNLVFSGSGDSDTLKNIEVFLTQNYKDKDIIKLIEESTLALDKCSFIIIKKKEFEIYYFEQGSKRLFNNEVLIFGDQRVTYQPYEETLKISQNIHKKDIFRDQIAFIMHQISEKIHSATISSPFTSGVDLWEIKKTIIHKYKLKNYFRWEND